MTSNKLLSIFMENKWVYLCFRSNIYRRFASCVSMSPTGAITNLFFPSRRLLHKFNRGRSQTLRVMKYELAVLPLSATFCLLFSTVFAHGHDDAETTVTTAVPERIALKLLVNLVAALKWPLTTDPCNGDAPWPGLQCSLDDDLAHGADEDVHYHVTSLDASAKAVKGQLPDDAIGSLDHLTLLDLSDNALDGALAKMGISRLPSLIDLNLSGNALTGTIPLDLLQRTNHTVGTINLSHNRLTGVLNVPPKGTEQFFPTADVRCNQLTGTSLLNVLCVKE